MEKERGYTVCRNGGLKKGPEVTGTNSSVSVPISCPPGSRPVAIFHTHPGGTTELSPLDIRTMNEKGLSVCVKAGNQVKCYRPKKK